ncbi:amidohydrolase family protein [Runella sp.]|uniref:amidohydrolase family protein n=1 Tax=Runella sp. TaxID=1960881 RepID=UPI003D0F214D
MTKSLFLPTSTTRLLTIVGIKKRRSPAAGKRTLLFRGITFLFLWLAHSTDVSAQVKALYFGELIDGLGKKITNAVVIINADRIVGVGKEKELIIPANAEIIDLKAYTAIPGLIDAHTHMTYYWDKNRPGDPWTQGRTVQPAVKVFLAQENAKKSLETGVTTVRDLGAGDNMSFAMRELIDRGAMKGPRMFVAGQGLSIGRTKGVVDVQQFAEKQLALGADWIKMFGSTGSAKDVTGFQTYSYEEMKAAAEVAHKAGKRLAVHSYGPDGAKAAVKAGANTIEHATDVDDSTFIEMARRGIIYVPTVDHNRYYAAHREEYGYDSTAVFGLNLFVKRNFESLKKAVKANVKIAMGSDAVFTGFGENTRELEWFVKAGMTPEQALQTATTTGAQMLGKEKELGAIAPGYYADIVAVKGNPLKDINVVIQQVKWVMKGGKVEIDKTTALKK